MSCSPQQSKWLRAAKFDNPKNPKYIKAVDYFITPTFVNGMFNSCKDVQIPSANMKALSMVCGTTAAKCTPKIWVDYMGDIQNGQTPFPINFTIVNDPVKEYNETFFPMNATIIPCSKAVGNRTSACSCQDCESSCSPIPPPPPPTKPWKILNLDAAVFIMGCVFIVFTIVFGIYVIIYNIFVRDALGFGGGETNDFCCNNLSINGEKDNVDEATHHKILTFSDISLMERIGSKFENFFTVMFTGWGIWCAKHSVLVLVVGLIVILSLSGGIFLFKVCTISSISNLKYNQSYQFFE